MRIATVSDPQVAPDGESILCIKRVVDVEKDKYRGEIWRVANYWSGDEEVDEAAKEPQRFTGGNDYSDGFAALVAGRQNRRIFV